MNVVMGRAAALAGWLALSLSCVTGCGGDGGAQGGAGGAGTGAQGGGGQGGTGGDCGVGGGGAGNPAPSACEQPFVPLAGASDGDYLLSLSFPQGPELPTLFLAKVGTPGLCLTEIGMNVTPLDRQDRKTPVGAEQALGSVPLGPDGGFVFEVPLLTVPAKANTIVPIDLEMVVTLAGHACGDGSFLCGTLSGEVVTPDVSLDGSTFALQRITDPQAYPEPVINCAQDPAEPL